MVNQQLDNLRRIEDSLARLTPSDIEFLRVGPFRARFHPELGLVWLNYAKPVAPLDDETQVAEAFAKLARAFVERQRVPRFEYIGELWPELAEILLSHGYELQARQPLMVCTPSSFRPVDAPGVSVRLLDDASPDADLAIAHRIQAVGFGEAAIEPPAETLARTRGQMSTGELRIAIAILDGQPAGAATVVPSQGIGELVGVATHPSHRRRGVARTLCSALTRDHFEKGSDLLWLSAGDTTAAATYEGIGFMLGGTVLNYIAKDRTGPGG